MFIIVQDSGVEEVLYTQWFILLLLLFINCYVTVNLDKYKSEISYVVKRALGNIIFKVSV